MPGKKLSTIRWTWYAGMRKILITGFCSILMIILAPVRAQDQARDFLMARLAKESSGPLFAKLTPLLLDYVETIVAKDKLADLYQAQNRDDFLGRLTALTGKDIIDLGRGMFAFFEARMPKIAPAAWTKFQAGKFLVHVRPGSAAEADRDVIAMSLADFAARAADALGSVEPFEAACSKLKSDEENPGGLIAIYLHAGRGGDGAEKIKKESTGSASLGATIVDGQGRLTFRIDILYLNAMSLTVIEHEAAHAVVLLSSFDVNALTSKPLAGEGDLRKVFFAGYKKIPTFLQEGLGDWGFFYHGFYKNWGLLPSPEALVASLRNQGKTQPLKDILEGGARFMGSNRKAYSLEAASFIEFLLRTEGKEKMRKWLLSGETNGARSFEAVFGRPVEAAEKEWLRGQTYSLRTFPERIMRNE